MAADNAALGLPVSFTDLTYKVPVKGNKDGFTILSGLTSNFEPGRLTALMGPSGCGKTTLMDVLSGRKNSGSTEGEILFGGAACPKSSLQSLCGYVEQFDTLVDELTVEQMLQYTAELKMPRQTGSEEKKKRVQEVIAQLRLGSCTGTVIGNALRRGISGGQAKRVNIALALIHRPKVIFLDEPTSGLDSKMANDVCSILAALAQEGRTIVSTIHSPTSFAFSLFDDLLMLHKGGRALFNGPVRSVKDYFATHGYPMPDGGLYSLPDFIVDTTGGTTEESGDQVDFVKIWENSEFCQAKTQQLTEAISALKSSPTKPSLESVAGPGQLHALRTLLSFRTRAHYKNGEFLGPRIGDKVFLAFITFTLYWGIGDKKDGQSIQSTASVLYFVSALCGYGAAAYVPSLALERPLFYRERADGCYIAATYFAGKFLEEAILCVLTSLIFCIIVFWAMSLQGSFLIFAGGFYLTAMCGIVLAYVVASVAPTMEAANALLPTYVTTCMYFGGLFIVFDKIPVYYKWYSWTSFLRYSWGTLMLNQFKDQDTGELAIFCNEALSCQNILEFYGMSEDDGIMNSIGGCVGCLAGITMFVAVLGALALTYMSHVKR